MIDLQNIRAGLTHERQDRGRVAADVQQPDGAVLLADLFHLGKIALFIRIHKLFVKCRRDQVGRGGGVAADDEIAARFDYGGGKCNQRIGHTVHQQRDLLVLPLVLVYLCQSKLGQKFLRAQHVPRKGEHAGAAAPDRDIRAEDFFQPLHRFKIDIDAAVLVYVNGLRQLVHLIERGDGCFCDKGRVVFRLFDLDAEGLCNVIVIRLRDDHIQMVLFPGTRLCLRHRFAVGIVFGDRHTGKRCTVIADIRGHRHAVGRLLVRSLQDSFSACHTLQFSF